MRIALVHDYLCTVGGSERVFEYMCEAIPEADVFTLALNPKTTTPYFARRANVRTTWLNAIVKSPRTFRVSFPIATYVMEHLDLSAYDLVVSSSATVAKYVKAPRAKHVCYCYIPTRAIWHFDAYFGPGVVGQAFRLMLPWLRSRDLRAAARVNEFIAISEMTRGYIREYYGRESRVLNSPIDLSAFRPSSVKSDAFLIVSRLEHWKRLDYAIEAFTRLGLPLRVVGQGSDEQRLRSLAGPNVSFLGAVDDASLATEYASARAVVFTPALEYGLIPLEAVASGTPVIAYGVGGIRETMIGAGDGSKDAPTAILFAEQTADAVIDAVRRFETTAFDSAALVRHASKWSVPEFQLKLREMLQLPKRGTIAGTRG